MKSTIFAVLLPLALCGCTQSPTISNPTVTQSLTLSNPSVAVTGSGVFYDITTNSSTSFSITGLPFTWYFQTGKHDTVYFTLSLSSACTFSYAIGTTSASASTDGSGNYTSSQITF
jgi:hypothetical protein